MKLKLFLVCYREKPHYPVRKTFTIGMDAEEISSSTERMYYEVKVVELENEVVVHVGVPTEIDRKGLNE
jgi:hypothetical protein